MLKFYDVDEKYVDFLQTIDKQVPNIRYSGNNKFVCGIVLNINGIEYYAPISHKTDKQRTSLQIFDNGIAISAIRFSFMFPAYKDVLSKKDFSLIAKTDMNYANLLRAEYSYCRTHMQEIFKKAMSVYKIGCNKNHQLNYACCDFKKLEKNYLNYNNKTT